jgi:N-acetylglucosaminyl-diphospho-decaprenol L-rhamnosyltransferase
VTPSASDAAAQVSAVVVNYNARDLLLRAIQSLRVEGIADIVVADNASVDGSEAAVRAADLDVVYVQTGANLGYGTGANRGVAHTDPASRFVLIANADTLIEPGSIKAMVAALEADPRRGVVGPVIEQLDGSMYSSPRVFPTLGDAIGHAYLGMFVPNNRWTRRYRMLGWDHSQPADVDWVSGSCFMVRRDAWDELRGFDEAYFMYAEDLDLCWRAHRAGWKVAFEPAARVVHVQGASTDRHPYWMILEHHKGLLRFAVRWTTGRQRLLLPLMALGLAVRTPVAWAHRAWKGRAVK